MAVSQNRAYFIEMPIWGKIELKILCGVNFNQYRIIAKQKKGKHPNVGTYSELCYSRVQDRARMDCARTKLYGTLFIRLIRNLKPLGETFCPELKHNEIIQ